MAKKESKKDYTREQYWQLFQKLPQELRTHMLAQETADDIHNICERNEVSTASVPKIAKYTGYVLLGVLPPDDFQKTLEKEAKLKKTAAKKVAQEIHRHIFFPVRTLLSELYKVEVAPMPGKPGIKAEVKPPVTPEAEVKAPPAKEKPKRPDIYREPLK